MRYAILTVLVTLAMIVPVSGYETRTADPDAEQAVRFIPLHIYIDSGAESLGAYQFELRAISDRVKIVGVEGGEHEAFTEPAYYDPAALMNDRIIVGAFSTGKSLPTGKTRVATIHLQITGGLEWDYELTLTVAGDREGNEIPAKLTTTQGDQN